MSTIYLLHFDKPLKHAKHYIGLADDLDERLNRHRAGHGARLMAVIQAAGITWQLARTWQGDRKMERKLKRLHATPRLCPICSPSSAGKRANNYRKEKKR